MYLRTVKRNLRTHLRTVKRKHMYFRTVKRNLRVLTFSQTLPTYALTLRMYLRTVNVTFISSAHFILDSLKQFLVCHIVNIY